MIRSHRSIWRTFRLALAAVGLGACAADSPTAPMPPDASPALLADLFKKQPLERDVSLRSDVTVRALIGSGGGRISLPGQGFTLIVPRGAVRNDTRFSVTAVAGTMVAYEFEPHGTTFRVPLVAIQDLNDTSYRLRLLSSLTAGYFESRTQLFNLDGTVILNELIPGILSPLTGRFSWPIEHFSGYIVAF
ncbi:MAG TPA: hypothetical protein VF981_02380 [Gemmatimonadaceae bacterium]